MDTLALILSIIGAVNWGLVGIWVAMACDEGLRGALFTLRFRQGQWRKKRLV